MKKLVLLLTVALFTISMSAQQRQRSTPEERAKRQTQEMVEKLGLSDSQKEKIHEINLKYAQPMQQGERPQNMDRDKMRAEFEKRQKEKDTEIKAQLTEDQQKKYEKYQKENQNRMRQGGREGARR